MSDKTPTTNIPSNISELLKTKRNEQGLSIQQVSRSLHLDPNIILALEENKRDELPEPAYVKGYINNYAKLLDIDQSIIEHLYQPNLKHTPKINHKINTQKQAASNDNVVKLITYLITLILVLSMFAWWRSQYLQHPDPEKNIKTTSPPAFNYPYDIVIHPPNNRPVNH